MTRRSENMKSTVFLLCLYFLQTYAFPNANQGYWVGPGIKVPAVDDNPYVEQDNRLREELDFLLGTERDPVPLKPGQVLLECSNKKTHPFGCCPDRKTKATQEDKLDCGPKLCIDMKVVYCARVKKERKIDCREADRQRCAHTCRNCKKPASPLEKCRNAGYRYGCCWNGVPALTPGGRDCIRCRDFQPHTCKQFYWKSSGGCNSPSYGIRAFLETQCAKTCGICDYSYSQK